MKGTDYKKYKFRKYDSIYPELFEKEKKRIMKILGKNIEIEHVGSTSVPGLGGKGIIDIAIKTPKNKIKLFIKRLKKVGYEYNPEHPKDARRIFLQRRIFYKGKERRVHIHLTLNKLFWDSFIVFRDYLINDNKSCKEYAQIKKEAIKYAKGDGKKYRDYKNSFLQKILKKALRGK